MVGAENRYVYISLADVFRGCRTCRGIRATIARGRSRWQIRGRQKAEMRNANGIPFSALSSFTGSVAKKKKKKKGERK